MQQRHATAPSQIPSMTTDDLRRHYLVDDLFADDEVRAVHSHHDRVVLVGALPRTGALDLPAFPELRSEHFFDRREAGIVNVGGPGTVTVDGEVHRLTPTACLYVGRGARDVSFASDDGSAPAAFYLFSATAHTGYPTVLVEPGGGTVLELGDPLTSNRRTLTQYVHEDGVRSCQVVMGVTTLHPGSMWNTMPSHTHERRTEVYLYFGLPEDARVVHLLGEPTETRHLVVADRQAVISPPWSVHSGVGTASYSFVWAMAGENQAFADMDPHPAATLR
ncbi:MAG: 5-dehydro-4-deoxy-D-glucuronate isomerase [Saccharothrix sp.]|nr:5-dehydro-4-deoxy-D-glucuronate isomerase [Saccharothrix sp.]